MAKYLRNEPETTIEFKSQCCLRQGLSQTGAVSDKGCLTKQKTENVKHMQLPLHYLC